MVKFDTVLIRYGELSTKGKNRKDFINRLFHNVKAAFKDIDTLTYRKTHDRIYIDINDLSLDVVKDRLSKVFGISSFSFTKKVETNFETIQDTCLQIAKESNAKTFKMITRRHDKTFPMVSDEINRKIAGHILKNSDLKVDVHNPDLPIQIEIHSNETYITTEKIQGAGGYPTGINGKVLLMLSGGIDSPVAAYQIMKRGLKVEAIHFASPPYTSEKAKEKVMMLAEKIAQYQEDIKVHIINFTDLQLNIYRIAKDPYAITIMRRMMFRLAQRVANDTNCLAIGTGESIGQVASQTLESMRTINDVVSIPVIRPLVCMDKVEIINKAIELGTYEISILPYEDCCTIFDPKNPVTKPTIEKSEFFEEQFDYQTMLDTAIETQEVKSLEFKIDNREDFL